MPYSFTPVVLLPSATAGAHIDSPIPSGFSTSFANLLFSFWMFWDGAPLTSLATPGFTGFQFEVDTTFITFHPIQANGNTTGTVVYHTPPGLLGRWSHVILSANTATETAQLYINGATVPAFINVWSATSPMGVAISDGIQFGGVHTLGADLCVADLYIDTPGSFYDLTVPANLAKFISGGNPVDLGATGQLPTGAQPQVFLSVPLSGTGPQFLLNLGSAGAFTATETIALCASGPFPPLVPSSGDVTAVELFFSSTTSFVDLSNEANRRKFVTASGATQDLYTDGSAPFGTRPAVFLTRYTGAAPNTFAANAGNGGAFAITGGNLAAASSAPPCAFEGTGSPWAADAPIVWLRWSDDRGRTWSNPIPQSIGSTGQYLTQPSWSRLGVARDRIFEVYGSIPGRFALNSAWLDPEPIRLKS